MKMFPKLFTTSRINKLFFNNSRSEIITIKKKLQTRKRYCNTIAKSFPFFFIVVKKYCILINCHL